MEPIEGVDYSTDTPSIEGLAAVGKRFACRYVGPGTAPKHLSAAEAVELTARGLSIVANAEGIATGLLGGESVGRAWASSAHAHAVRCGMPATRPIYLSVDFDVQAEQWSQVRDALRAAGGVLGLARVGVYGGYDAIAWAARDKVASWFWQAAAWSEGRWHPLAHIRQYRNKVSLVGGTVDLDRAMVADYGQWTVGGIVHPGGDEDMTPEQARKLDDIDFTLKHAHNLQGEEALPFHNWSGIVNDSLVALLARTEALETKVAGLDGVNEDVARLLEETQEVLTSIRDAPLIDPVAVAAAIAAQPEVAATLAKAVADRLAAIDGEITLTGGLHAAVHPPAQ